MSEDNDNQPLSNDAANDLIGRNGHVFQELGKITRQLHDAISGFNVRSAVEESMVSDQLSDAKLSVTYILDMTEKAAMTTLDCVEVALPQSKIVKQGADHLIQELDRLSENKEHGVMLTPEVLEELQEYLWNASQSSEAVNGKLNEIALAQDFQDLTGQAFSKVVDVVQYVESNLVSLIQMVIDVNRSAGIGALVDPSSFESSNNTPDIKGEGPDITQGKASDRVNSQDDVDDLLSSLGF